MIPPQQYQPSGRAILIALSLSLSFSRSLGDAINLDGGCQERRDRAMRGAPSHTLPACGLTLAEEHFFPFHYGYPPSVCLHMASNPTTPAQHPNSCRAAPDNLALISENRKSLVRDRLLLFVCLFLIALLTLCHPKRPPSLTFGMSHRCVSLQRP